MKIDEAVKYLERFNAWRRDVDDKIPPEKGFPCPKTVGIAIDTVLDYVKAMNDKAEQWINNEYLFIFSKTKKYFKMRDAAILIVEFAAFIMLAVVVHNL